MIPCLWLNQWWIGDISWLLWWKCSKLEVEANQVFPILSVSFPNHPRIWTSKWTIWPSKICWTPGRSNSWLPTLPHWFTEGPPPSLGSWICCSSAADCGRLIAGEIMLEAIKRLKMHMRIQVHKVTHGQNGHMIRPCKSQKVTQPVKHPRAEISSPLAGLICSIDRTPPIQIYTSMESHWVSVCSFRRRSNSITLLGQFCRDCKGLHHSLSAPSEQRRKPLSKDFIQTLF